MRSARCLVALVLLCCPSCKLPFGGSGDAGGPGIISALASLVSFEGDIEMSMDYGTLVPGASLPAITTTFTIKGDKIRVQSKGLAGFVTISDMSAKKTWMLDSSAHTYTEIDMAALSATTASAKPPAKVKKTGRTDKVAGYACDVYELDDATMRTETCVASGLSMMALGLSGPFGAFTKGNDGWSEVLSHGFPLRITMLDASGKPMMKMEATRIDKKSVPDADMRVPPGYTKTPSMFGGGASAPTTTGGTTL